MSFVRAALALPLALGFPFAWAQSATKPVTFSNPLTLTAGTAPSRLASGDFNGDGKMDLVVVNLNDGTLSVFLGNGDGTFRTASTISISGVGFNNLVVGDFNGDRVPDLAVFAGLPQNAGVYSVGVVIFLGNGDGTFGKPNTITFPNFPGGEGLASGDFNGDGKLDLAVAVGGTNWPQQKVFILIGNGDGSCPFGKAA